MVWASGQKLQGGKYIIEKELGQGGCGVTYCAREENGQLVVIKALNFKVQQRPDFDLLQQDFLNEALRLAKCTHPHIVKIIEVFQEGRLWCMVMEYIEGEDLASRVAKRGSLSEAEALQYIQQIGEALTVVHSHGLLHRDVKPHNIMVRSGKSEAILIDFGIAREFTPDLTQTHTENRTEYFAPLEQYERRAKRGAYTDVYALAATLYVLLTSQLPTPAPLRAINKPLPPPKQYNSNLSDSVNRAILKGMELEAQKRPQSVQEWLELLGLTPTINVIGANKNYPINPKTRNLLIGGAFLFLGVTGYGVYRLVSPPPNLAPRDLKLTTAKPTYNVTEKIQVRNGLICDDNGIGDIERVDLQIQKYGGAWQEAASSLKQDFKLVREDQHCFSFTHDLKPLPAGSYQLQAIAYDHSGSKIESGINSFKVNSAPKELKIKIDKNLYGLKDTVSITGYVFDPNGSNDLFQVELFVNEELKGSIKAPLTPSRQDKRFGTFNYKLSNLKPDLYALKVIATDNSREKLSSEVINFKVNADPKDLSFKLSKSSYNSDEEVSIIDGKIYDDNPEDIEKVHFVLSKAGTKIAEYDATDIKPASQGGRWVMFKLSLGKLSPGSYTLLATATDKSGKSTDSPPVEFLVVEKQAPTEL